MEYFKQIIKDESILCRLSAHVEYYRKISYEGQPEKFGLIDAIDSRQGYLGSMPLWWKEEDLEALIKSPNKDGIIHRITVSTLCPMIHFWTYEDFLKSYCKIEKIGKIELLPSSKPKIYDQISFLVREVIDNETHKWESREIDIDNAYNSVCRWCYDTLDNYNQLLAN